MYLIVIENTELGTTETQILLADNDEKANFMFKCFFPLENEKMYLAKIIGTQSLEENEDC